MTSHASRLPSAVEPLIAGATQRMRHRRFVIVVGAGILALSLLAYSTLQPRAHSGMSDSTRTGLKTFAGDWGGHGRGLQITRSGQGREVINLPRPQPPFAASLTFRIFSVTVTPARAEARYRITGTRAWNRWVSVAPVYVGAVGILRLQRGVITDSITEALFCGPGAAPGACGA